MTTGPGHDALDDGEPLARGAQRRRGFGTMLARQPPHLGHRDIRGIAHDDIVAPRSEAVIDVGGDHAHATAEAVALHVVTGDRAGPGGDVRRIDPGARKRVRGRDCDAAGTRADVEHAADTRRLDPRREPGDTQLGDRRARHEHVRRHANLVAGEPADAGEVGRRQAFPDAALDERFDATRIVRGNRQPIAGWRRFVRQAERMEHERGGVVARIVRAVPVMQPRLREPQRGAVEERADIGDRLGAGAGLFRHRGQSNRGAHEPRATMGYFTP